MPEYRIAARILLNDIKKKHRRLKSFRAGYRGPIMDALANQEKLKIGIVKRGEEKAFKLLPKCWIVERSFAWLEPARRLAKHYESLDKTQKAMIRLRFIQIALNRIKNLIVRQLLRICSARTLERKTERPNRALGKTTLLLQQVCCGRFMWYNSLEFTTERQGQAQPRSRTILSASSVIISPKRQQSTWSKVNGRRRSKSVARMVSVRGSFCVPR